MNAGALGWLQTAALGLSIGPVSDRFTDSPSLFTYSPSLAWTGLADTLLVENPEHLSIDPICISTEMTMMKSGYALIDSGASQLGNDKGSGDDEERLARYTALAQHNAETAIAMVAEDVNRRLLSPQDATTWLFERMMGERPRGRDRYYEGLLAIGVPDNILSVALEQYRQRGNEQRLVLAASLLGDLGVRSWPALRRLARTLDPACEYFVSVIASVDGVSRSEKIAALADLARSSEPDVLWGVVNALENEPELRSAKILEAIPGDSDSDVIDAVRELVSSALVA